MATRRRLEPEPSDAEPGPSPVGSVGRPGPRKPPPQPKLRRQLEAKGRPGKDPGRSRALRATVRCERQRRGPRARPSVRARAAKAAESRRVSDPGPLNPGALTSQPRDRDRDRAHSPQAARQHCGHLRRTQARTTEALPPPAPAAGVGAWPSGGAAPPNPAARALSGPASPRRILSSWYGPAPPPRRPRPGRAGSLAQRSAGGWSLAAAVLAVAHDAAAAPACYSASWASRGRGCAPRGLACCRRLPFARLRALSLPPPSTPTPLPGSGQPDRRGPGRECEAAWGGGREVTRQGARTGPKRRGEGGGPRA